LTDIASALLALCNEIGTTVKPDEGFVDDDFIQETAREYVSRYGFNSELSVKAPHPSIQEVERHSGLMERHGDRRFGSSVASAR
jgi:hypothetical protein